jgi:hypothetical protein
VSPRLIVGGLVVVVVVGGVVVVVVLLGTVLTGGLVVGADDVDVVEVGNVEAVTGWARGWLQLEASTAMVTPEAANAAACRKLARTAMPVIA